MNTVLEIVWLVLPYIITFLLGLIIKSPLYNTIKKTAQQIVKAIEDDKLTSEEIQEIKDAISGK